MTHYPDSVRRWLDSPLGEALVQQESRVVEEALDVGVLPVEHVQRFVAVVIDTNGTSRAWRDRIVSELLVRVVLVVFAVVGCVVAAFSGVVRLELVGELVVEEILDETELQSLVDAAGAEGREAAHLFAGGDQPDQHLLGPGHLLEHSVGLVLELQPEPAVGTDVLRIVRKDNQRALRLAAAGWSDEEIGRMLFFSQVINCHSCHLADAREDRPREPFTTFRYHNIGVPPNERLIQANGTSQGWRDAGLLDNSAVADQSAAGKFRVPTLRNVAVTAPYMHDGRLRSLTDVVDQAQAECPVQVVEPPGVGDGVGGRRALDELTEIDRFVVRLQVFMKQDNLGLEGFSQFKTWDVGDIAGVTGTPFVTRTGELTILANESELLTKSVRPLPEKWHGLKDTEIRYRQEDFLSSIPSMIPIW